MADLPAAVLLLVGAMALAVLTIRFGIVIGTRLGARWDRDEEEPGDPTR